MLRIRAFIVWYLMLAFVGIAFGKTADDMIAMFNEHTALCLELDAKGPLDKEHTARRQALETAIGKHIVANPHKAAVCLLSFPYECFHPLSWSLLYRTIVDTADDKIIAVVVADILTSRCEYHRLNGLRSFAGCDSQDKVLNAVTTYLKKRRSNLADFEVKGVSGFLGVVSFTPKDLAPIVALPAGPGNDFLGEELLWWQIFELPWKDIREDVFRRVKEGKPTPIHAVTILGQIGTRMLHRRLVEQGGNTGNVQTTEIGWGIPAEDAVLLATLTLRYRDGFRRWVGRQPNLYTIFSGLALILPEGKQRDEMVKVYCEDAPLASVLNLIGRSPDFAFVRHAPALRQCFDARLEREVANGGFDGIGAGFIRGFLESIRKDEAVDAAWREKTERLLRKSVFGD